MKFLCVCDCGNVRSHAMAYTLHDQFGYEAIPIGRLRVSVDTMKTMCEWADIIIIMQAHMDESIPEEYKNKMYCIDVGEDRFGINIHPDLLNMTKEGAKWIIDKLSPKDKL